MDPQALALAGTAGTTVVTLLATDAWQQTKSGVLALWRRFGPQAAEEVDGLLSEARQTLLGGAVPGAGAAPGPAGEQARQRLESAWQLRFGVLLAEHPEAADGLTALLDSLAAAAGTQTVHGGVRLEAHAEGNARIYQSLRDQTINEHR
ncbi:hypothetical protein [Streptomyces pinistramenti]|uniref:hypothetical protein n=1 Tax=Streptomyces pinistramenti TaxID=2884812 RepID=UPI001D067362|nr:hypothetical protein [Streptomyces pinistramenti]MCB5908039.1 hypothetical protein [Streptomyces pinistramenti]